MPDCNMCWNEWPSLTGTPFPRIPDTVQVCRNCARSMKQVIAFTRHHGVNLVTGELSTAPQAGSETLVDHGPGGDSGSKPEEEPPSPPAKGARKAR